MRTARARRLTRAAMHQLLGGGWSESDLALVFGMTERGVRYHLQALDRDADRARRLSESLELAPEAEAVA